MFSTHFTTDLSFVSDLTANQGSERFSKVNVFSFDGKEIKVEPSSNYPHNWVGMLGVYKGDPFVTGSKAQTFPNNTKTEILDAASNQWIMGKDYPWSSGDQ